MSIAVHALPMHMFTHTHTHIHIYIYIMSDWTTLNSKLGSWASKTVWDLQPFTANSCNDASAKLD